MDTPAFPTEPEPQKPLPSKVGWMAGRDWELALMGVGCAAGLIYLSSWYGNPASPLSPPLQEIVEWLKLVPIVGSLLFSCSGMRHEKGLARALCAFIFCGWIILFLVILRIAWH